MNAIDPVQAVAEAIWHSEVCTGDPFDPRVCDDDQCQDTRERQAEAAIAAARPAIEREAKAAALREAAHDEKTWRQHYAVSPTGLASRHASIAAEERLLDSADRIEREGQA